MSFSGQDQSKQQQQQKPSRSEAKEIEDEKAKKEASGVSHAWPYEDVLLCSSLSERAPQQAQPAWLAFVIRCSLVMHCCTIDTRTTRSCVLQYVDLQNMLSRCARRISNQHEAPHRPCRSRTKSRSALIHRFPAPCAELSICLPKCIAIDVH